MVYIGNDRSKKGGEHSVGSGINREILILRKPPLIEVVDGWTDDTDTL